MMRCDGHIRGDVVRVHALKRKSTDVIETFCLSPLEIQTQPRSTEHGIESTDTQLKQASAIRVALKCKGSIKEKAQVKIKTMSNLITVITYLYSFVSFTLNIVFSLVD